MSASPDGTTRYPGEHDDSATIFKSHASVVTVPPPAPRGFESTVPFSAGRQAPVDENPPLDVVGRLQVLDEIARGGMGVVHKGRDTSITRELAVKVLLGRHLDRPDIVRRFLEEAQICGQLQHPGIVPVYEMGILSDARPFFSMKFVNGNTLAELLVDRTPQKAPRYLAIVEAVAQTVAYAHARGVIHRDLKPLNVMVGAFGEVQVMDWGLAKILRRGAEADQAESETVAETTSSSADNPIVAGSDSNLSMAGAAMGTPAYMAPEQARGEIEAIDERVDVFALGSILCEVFTGDPALRGSNVSEIIQKAAEGDLSDAFERLDACEIDSELKALTKACLAPDRERRPRDAGIVADRIAEHLAGVQEKLRRAELARVESELARTKEVSRRRLTTLAAAGVIVFLTATGGGYLWLRGQRAELAAKTARAVDEALADAARLRGEAQASSEDLSKWDSAIEAAKRAEALLAQGVSEAPLRSRVAAMLAGIGRERQAAEEKGRRLEVDRKLLNTLELIRGDRSEHLDFKRTDDEYAAAFREAGLDVDKAEPKESGAWLAARSQPMELIAYFDDWVFVRDRWPGPDEESEKLVSIARFADKDPWRDSLRVASRSENETARESLRRLADDEKTLDAQPPTSLVMLAYHLRTVANDNSRAERVLRRAWSRHPADYWLNDELAKAPGKDGGSLKTLYPRPRESLRYRTVAVAVRPMSPLAHVHLGIVLQADDRLSEAEEAFHEAIRLKSDHGYSYNALGNCLLALGRLEEAVEAYRTALKHDPKFHACYANLGSALEKMNKLEEAAAACRESIRLKPTYSLAYFNLGRILRGQGKNEEAVAAYRESIRLAPPDDHLGYYNLGFTFSDMNRPAEAVAAYRESIRRMPNYPSAHYNLGYNLERVGDPEAAVAAYREAIRLKPDHANALDNLGLTLRDLGKVEEAVSFHREAIKHAPTHLYAHAHLATALRALGRRTEALEVYRKVIGFSNKNPKVVEDYQGRIKLTEREIALAPRLAAVLKGSVAPEDAREAADLASMSYDERRFASAARLYAKAMELDPKLSEDQETRYSAACSAALAGCGPSRDEPPLDDQAKAKSRNEALEWLTAELAMRSRLVKTGDPKEAVKARDALEYWKEDSDLTRVRESTLLDRLPESERAPWRDLWKRVESLRAELATAKSPAKP